MKKGEIACNMQFLLSSQCLYSIWYLFFHFLHILWSVVHFYTHFEMSSATSFKLDQSKILSSGNGLRMLNMFVKQANQSDVSCLILSFSFQIHCMQGSKGRQRLCPAVLPWNQYRSQQIVDFHVCRGHQRNSPAHLSNQQWHILWIYVCF